MRIGNKEVGVASGVVKTIVPPVVLNFQFSILNCAALGTERGALLVSQRFDRIELRGTLCRKIAEDDADRR